jgi:probable F420-dependent oxidoreductase
VIRLGVLLPTFDPLRTGAPQPVAEAARLAEELGFHSVWAGDHLACPAPGLEAVGCLAAAAAVTERVWLGFSVMLLGLRQPAWAAKQLVTIDALSGGRLRLGVGVGGEFPEEFQAAGARVSERGARLDEALTILPDLLTGRPVEHAGATLRLKAPALAPAMPAPPPILVGGRSQAALRRCARYGDAWMPMWMAADRLARMAERLGELAEATGRRRPALALLVGVHVSDDLQLARREAGEYLAGQYGLTLETVERWTALGSIDRVAEFIESYRAVGVEDVVLMPLARDPLRQYQRLAELRPRLRA